ncbi:nucleotide exchange factor GrpE [Microbacterium testaceum]|uniref:nucleotide exchange factor GrpE n=1 Tax=Microbacterium testaceum TaxID=2033 RepID=UPI0007345F7B|nr:nucleotide exchange factor GrpE [Microbacterium testaceum]
MDEPETLIDTAASEDSSGPEPTEASDAEVAVSADDLASPDAADPTDVADPTDGTDRTGEAERAEDADAPADLPLILAALDRLNERLRASEEANRKLQSRVESLQDDQVRALLKPVFERLASLHSQSREMVSTHRGTADDAADDFDYFATAIEGLLGLYDIVSVDAAVGAPLDARVHFAVGSKPTDDVALDGTIQRVQRQGFTYAGAGRTLLPARVIAYRHNPLSAD